MEGDRERGRILLVRHGRTRYNAGGRRLGRADVPLDDVGRAQADRLAEVLRDERIDAIYASPLTRARDTAAPTARTRGLDIGLDDDLLEFDYGDLAGTSRATTKVPLRRAYLTMPVPGGESLRDVWVRAERFVRRLRAEFRSDAQVLVVGHRRTNRMLMGVLHGFTLEQAAAAGHYRPEPGQLVGYDVVVAGDSLRLADASG